MYLWWNNFNKEDNPTDTLMLEFMGEDNNKRFIMFFEDDCAGWCYVARDHSDVDDMSDGDLDEELLEHIHQRIGKILGK
jgi:hypothetical protein